MISAAQVRAALDLLGWTAPTLAKQALLAFDDVTRAMDDIDVRHLGGLQLGAVRDALEVAEVELMNHGEPGVRLRKAPSSHG